MGNNKRELYNENTLDTIGTKRILRENSSRRKNWLRTNNKSVRDFLSSDGTILKQIFPFFSGENTFETE